MGTSAGQPLLGTNNGELRIEYENGRLMVNKGGTDIMMAGNDLAGDVVVKIAKPGVDVKTAADEDLIFNSAQNVLKIVKSGTTTIPGLNAVPGDHELRTITIAHNLGYIPILQAYGEVTNFVSFDDVSVVPLKVYTLLPYNADDGLQEASILNYKILAGVDSQNVYFSYLFQTAPGGSFVFPDVPIKYYLLQETAT